MRTAGVRRANFVQNGLLMRRNKAFSLLSLHKMLESLSGCGSKISVRKRKETVLYELGRIRRKPLPKLVSSGEARVGEIVSPTIFVCWRHENKTSLLDIPKYLGGRKITQKRTYVIGQTYICARLISVKFYNRHTFRKKVGRLEWEQKSDLKLKALLVS